MVLYVKHDVKQRRFYTVVEKVEYALEYNEIKSDLWEFHCPYDPHAEQNLKQKEIEEYLIEFALNYMYINNIRLFETGSCYHVKDFLDRKRDLGFLIKYIV